MSKFLSTIAIAGLVLSLVACSSTGGAADPASCPTTASGKSSDSVKVSGKFGVEPKVTVKKGLKVEKTQRSVIITGKGALAKKGNNATVAIAAYDGTTGKKLSASGYDADTATTVPVDATKVIAGLVKAIQCSPAGSRVVAAMPPADGFGDQGTSMGMAATDTLVLVVDVLKTSKPAKLLPRANGKDQAPQPGFPTVKLAADGTPTVTMPGGTPPKDLKLEVLKKGTGKKVGKSANVTVNYQGIIWATKKVFNDSWAAGAPVPFNTGQVVPGFQQAIEGQTVGSQVLVIIPPALGYGPAGGGGEGSGISATDTLVFLIDILGTD